MATRLGIIGAGQLGMYLCRAARRLGISTTLLAENHDMPAVPGATRVLIGELNDPATLATFLDHCDVVTFEKEDIPNESLTRIALAQQAGAIEAHPSAEALFMIKDKGLQKQWLLEQGFPTLPHRLLAGHAIDADALAREFGLPMVQKTRCGGYDGLGVQIIEDEARLAQLWHVPSVIEVYVPECREIAVLLARARDGQMTVYPPLGMAFDDDFNALSTVVNPADIPPALADQAVTLATTIVERLGEVGVFAVEMFIDRDDRLFVNEISPRVHNSGHLTMEASAACQFEQHVRAVTGLPLADIGVCRPAAMVNILYAEAMRQSCPLVPTDHHLPAEAVTLHWYGKEPGRIGRKMGHITALADTPRAAADRALARRAKLTDENRKEGNAAA